MNCVAILASVGNHEFTFGWLFRGVELDKPENPSQHEEGKNDASNYEDGSQGI
jgi:hypothetical protein